MNRRLKQRLAPAALAFGQRAPLILLLVTTTLVITPEALAKLEAGDAEVAVVMEKTAPAPNDKEKTYTKDELKKTMPANPNIEVSTRVGAELTSIINAISGNIAHNGGRKAQLDNLTNKAPEKDEYLMRQAQGEAAPTGRRVDMTQLRSYFGLETQKVVRNDVKEKFAAYAKVLNLARFNLNFSSLFGGSSTTSSAANGNIRYGLVVKDIKPDTSSPRVASIDDTADEMQYAGHADVQWTIEPVTEEHHRHVFDGIAADEIPPPAPDERDWKIKVPKASFHTDASTDQVEDVTKVSAAALPSAKFELTQDEDYYKMSYRTTMHGQRLGVDHTFKVPVAGTVALGRRLDDRFKIIETSAYNVLYDKRLPMLSIHELHIERRYRAEMSHNLSAAESVGVGFRSEAYGTLTNEADRPEQANVNYTRTF